MAEFKIEHDAQYPYEIGKLPNREMALTFVDYLNSIGIKATAHSTFSAAWAIFIANELQISRAKLELLRYGEQPFAREYAKSSWQTHKGEQVKKEKVFNNSSFFGLYYWQPLSVLSVLEIVCILVYVIGFFGDWLYYGFITHLSLSSIRDVTQGFEIWRLVTPIFLHFAFLHIAFNLVMAEAVGRPIERYLGHAKILFLVLVMAMVSNLLQLYLQGANSIFGGMSGVVYGLIGYAGILSHLRNDLPSGLYLPRGLMTVCVIFIAFGFFLNGVANFCHVGGMVCGALIGLWDAKFLKLS